MNTIRAPAPYHKQEKNALSENRFSKKIVGNKKELVPIALGHLTLFEHPYLVAAVNTSNALLFQISDPMCLFPMRSDGVTPSLSHVRSIRYAYKSMHK